MVFRLKELKDHFNETSEEMAEKLCVSRATIDAWSIGARTPRLFTIRHIEEVYHLNPGWITGENDEIFSPDNSLEHEIEEAITCKSDFALKTVSHLIKASPEEWNILQKIFRD